MTLIPNTKLPNFPTITSLSAESIGQDFAQLANITTLNPAITSGTANRAVFIPFTIDQPVTVNALFYATGSALNAGNIDLGIYTTDGVRIVSTGSTAQAGGSNVIQKIPITPVTLGPGTYYMAFVNNNASTGWSGILGTNLLEPLLTGICMQLSGFPLPAFATFAQMNSSYLVLMGLQIGSIL